MEFASGGRSYSIEDDDANISILLAGISWSHSSTNVSRAQVFFPSLAPSMKQVFSTCKAL
jgi:hypothetical protein